MTTTLTRTVPSDVTVRWPAFLVAVLVAVVLYLGGGAYVFGFLHLSSAASGLVQFGLSAAAPFLAFVAAVLASRGDLRRFGFRGVGSGWIVVAVGVALTAVVAANLAERGLRLVFPDAPNIQGDYDAAATGGGTTFLLVILLGGIIEPICEELLFRGVIAGFLRRWGAPVMILLSSTVFALAHGIDLVAADAFLVGLGSSILYWRTRSIWPSVLVHVVYNSVTLVLVALGH